MKTMTTQQCFLLAASAAMLTTSANAAGVAYNFNTDLSASTESGLTATDVVYAVGTNATGTNAASSSELAWDQATPSGDYMLNMGVKGIGNKGFADANLDILAAATVKFQLTPDSGNALDFTALSTLNFNASWYIDQSDVTYAYKVWADVGSTGTFAAVGTLQAMPQLAFSAGAEGRLQDTTEASDLAGIRLADGAIQSQHTAFSFDLDSLGTLAIDQNVTFAIAISSNRDNYFNVGTGIDDIVIGTVPEPSSAALLGLGGFALILRRRK